MERLSKNLKRPLAHFGMIFSVGLAVALLFSFKVTLVLSVLAAAGTIALRLQRRKRLMPLSFAVITAVALILAAALGFAAETKRQSAEELLFGTTEFTATVTGQKSATGLYYARLDTADGTELRGVSICFYDADFQIGDRFSATAEFSEPSPYMRATDRVALYFISEMSEVKLLPESDGAVRKLHTVRQKMLGILREYMPEDTAAVLGALITGDKSGITEEARRRMTIAGVAHILAVSGLHISAIAAAVAVILRKLRLSDALVFAVTTLFLSAAAFFFGGAPSVIRAVVMACYVFAARAAGRLPDSATAISLASVVVLMGNPYAVVSSGYLLSFGCVIALMLVYPHVLANLAPIVARLRRVKLAFLVKSVAASVTVQLVTLPILVVFGYPVSLVSAFTNLFMLPLVPVMMLTAFLTVALHPVPYAGDFAGSAAAAIGNVIVKAIDKAAAIPNAAIRLDTPRAVAIALLISVAILILLLAKRLKLRLLGILPAAVAAVLLLMAPEYSAVVHSGNAYITNGREAAVIVADADLSDLADISYAQTTGCAGEVKYVIITDKTYDIADIERIFPGVPMYLGGNISFEEINLAAEDAGIYASVAGRKILFSLKDGDPAADAILVLKGSPAVIPEGQISAVPYWLGFDGDAVFGTSDIVTLTYYQNFGYHIERSDS